MNKKGFVFIETVIVLVVLIVGVVSLYATYITLSTNINRRKNYDKISDLYKADIVMNYLNEELTTDLEEYIEINTDESSKNFCTRNMKEGCFNLLNELNIDKIYINLKPINEILEGHETITSNATVEYIEPLNNSLIEYLKTLKRLKSDGTYDYKKLLIVQFKKNENDKSTSYASLDYKLPKITVSKTLVQKILEDNNATVEESVPQRLVASNNDFDKVYEQTTPTFFRTNNAEHGDTVYYFAGANTAVNNWVIFGKCPATGGYNCTAGDDLYWRIIRTNEASTGGGIRLLYSGSGLSYIDSKKVIKSNTHNAYISVGDDYNNVYNANGLGYMHGTGSTNISLIRQNVYSSKIKLLIEDWYSDFFLNTDYENAVDPLATYCNDRSLASSSEDEYVFGADGRLYNNNSNGRNPSYACGTSLSGYGYYFTGGNDIADKFSVISSSYGNGLLKYPVALMTADEIAFAGGKDGSFSQSWYALNFDESATNGYGWWTMTPADGDSSGSSDPTIFVETSYANHWGLSTNYIGDGENIATRPVLSLKRNVEWLSGDGSPDDPYQVVIE